MLCHKRKDEGFPPWCKLVLAPPSPHQGVFFPALGIDVINLTNIIIIIIYLAIAGLRKLIHMTVINVVER